jgi:hypothetical protein
LRAGKKPKRAGPKRDISMRNELLGIEDADRHGRLATAVDA